MRAAGADGSLLGPALEIAGHEFCIGDEVVTRANNRQLHADDHRRFVKNGSLGTVIEVDQAAGELVVDFTREGRIRLPAEYPQRVKVEHAYARTNFLAQSQYLQRTKYHPTDASRFEEGYVGLTRAVEETKIYVVDGHAEDTEEDVSHTPSDRLVSDLDTVIAALEERGSQEMAHELDSATASSTESLSLAHRSLAELRRERERLDMMLAKAPPPVDAAIEKLTASRDELLARRKTWTLTMNESKPGVVEAEVDSLMPDSRVMAERTVGALERRLDRIEQQLGRLEYRQSMRNAFFEEHGSDVAVRQARRRSEVARELQIRLASLADPPEALAELMGSRPATQQQRLTWNSIVEDAAVASDRQGPHRERRPDNGELRRLDVADGDSRVVGVEPLDSTPVCE